MELLTVGSGLREFYRIIPAFLWRRTEETQKTTGQDSRPLDQDSDSGPSERGTP
jgi:hypothetical protein